MAKAIVVVSTHMKEQLISLGANPDKIFINACGANIPKDFKSDPQSAELRYLMVGRLVEKKAPFISIMAFAKVVEKYPNALLDIIGDGKLSGACHQIVDSLGLSGNVKFHGAQSHDTVFSKMRQSRCFIQHSVCTPNNDHEGTPVGVLEAMGMGLPVVATRHGGISDIIEDGINGSLVAEYDINAMADAMIKYASDPEYSQSIGHAARESILHNHTSSISVGNLQNILDTSLAAD